MPKAICLRCGHAKTTPWKVCANCGYDPAQSDDSLIKSVYLSIGRFEHSADRKKYSEELKILGERIRSGGTPKFEEAELERLKVQKATIAAIPSSAVWGALARFLLPAVAFLALLYAVMFAVEHFVKRSN